MFQLVPLALSERELISAISICREDRRTFSKHMFAAISGGREHQQELDGIALCNARLLILETAFKLLQKQKRNA